MSKGKGIGRVCVDDTPEVREDKRNFATERKAGLNAHKLVDVARMSSKRRRHQVV